MFQKKAVEETFGGEKGEDDGEKGEKYASAEVAGEEKGD